MDYNTPRADDVMYIDPDAYEAAWKATRETRPHVLGEYYSLSAHDAACGLEHVGCSRYRVIDARKWIIARLRYAW